MEITYELKALVEDVYKYNYDFDPSSLDKDGAGFRFSHSLKTDRDKGEVTIGIRIKIVDPKGEIDLVENSARSVFAITPYDSVIGSATENDLIVKIPALIDTFVNITIGALRGMLVKNLKGTPLEGCILPLIPMNIVRDNLKSSKRSR